MSDGEFLKKVLYKVQDSQKMCLTVGREVAIPADTFSQLLLIENGTQLTTIDPLRLGFVHCNTQSSQEEDIPIIFQLCMLHSIPLLFSFTISEWKDKSINRFHHYFKGAKCFDKGWSEVTDVTEHLLGNPSATLFFMWPESDTAIQILVPLYNGIEFLEECLQSIKAQIYQHWICTVGVNGHGEDGGDVFQKAGAIVRSLGDSRFSIVNIPHVRGAPQAINWMVEQSPRKWIAHLDADDRWHPMKLQCQVKTLELYGDSIDIMGTWCEYFGDWTGGPTIPPTFVHGTVFERMNPMIHSSILIKKHLAVYTDEFFGIYDYDCWCKNLIAGARFYNVPLPLTYHRVYNASAYNASGRQRPEEVRLKYFRHT